MDYSEEFNLTEWEWYMHINTTPEVSGKKKPKEIDPIILTNFNTEVGITL